MTHWIRFKHENVEDFGSVEGEVITIFEGNLFSNPVATQKTLPLAEVKVLTPCQPGKVVALWNNSKSLAEKNNQAAPEEPLYFLKAPNTFLASGETIQKPESYDGRVLYEGELGVVIGKTCKNVPEQDAAGVILGYTCVNDVTALQLIEKDPSFPQWTRAKGFDSFCPIGPVIATGLDPNTLSIKAMLNGRERQNYSVSDMFFAPEALVSLISRDMTLYPGDIISCGTGPGALPMKPGSTIDVVIDGIGTLSNTYE
ncbi:MAG: fumarylacetoacetate hydrolase family protein [Rhodospirillales bacterium]|nr:fumarylacetoacetate hydrolase family protein [Rhodospirillales bacterium]